MSKTIKKIIKKYETLGFIFKNGTKHIKAVHKDTKNMVTIARTPSDYRVYKNICKMLDNAMIL